MNNKFEYLLRLGDNALILGHRLSEWCGHGPVLEQDIAMTNIALDLVGQARSWLAYAGEVEGAGRSEDDLAYKRRQEQFRNVLLVEQPNGHWGDTIMRQFLFDVFNYYLHQQLVDSKDDQVAAIAAKSLKEITYHLRYSSEWVIRLGDGTEESHAKMQQSLNDLWTYSGETMQADAIDKAMQSEAVGADLDLIKSQYDQKVAEIFQRATLVLPDNDWMQKGGKQGLHSEHLSYILGELQYVERVYPNMTW